jgi:peptidyl-prolyl cis-trans isomerase C
MANKGTSEPKVLGEVKRQMVISQLSRQVTAGVTVSDQDLQQAFDQRRDKLATPELREIHNIVLRSKSEADDVAAQLAGGANFEQLAQQRSADASTKDQGGNLGLVAAAELDNAFATAAFSAPVGAVFGPVQSQFGFNVGKVVQSQPPAPADFNKIKEPLRQQLVGERVEAKWQDFLTGEIKKAHVVYGDSYRPADPDSAAPAPADQPGPAQSGPPAPGGQSAPGAEPAPGGQPAPGAEPAPGAPAAPPAAGEPAPAAGQPAPGTAPPR